MYKLKTKASTYPVTLSDVKSYCRVTHSVEDTIITSMMYAAISMVEEYAWMQLMNATWILQLNEWPINYVEIGKGIVSSISSVKYNDVNGSEQTLTVDTDYKSDLSSWPARIYFINQPTVNDRLPYIRIEFVAGYGSDATNVPDDIKNAIYLTARSLYDKRDGIASPGLPDGAMRILNNYRNSLVKR